MYNTAMKDMEKLVEELKRDARFMDQVTHWHTVPARPGSYAPFPGDIAPRLRTLLEKRGLRELYSHQLEAYRQVRSGKNVVVVTPTASGKTLSYNLPVVQTLLEHPESRALYLFPTKALSQDQQAELNEVVLGGELPLQVSTYDGDTPRSLRISARESGRIVISNPDMMHAGVLPEVSTRISAARCLVSSKRRAFWIAVAMLDATDSSNLTKDSL